MSRPIQYGFAEALCELVFQTIDASAALGALLFRLATGAAETQCENERQAAYRHMAQADRDFARRSTARLRALQNESPTVRRRALRELARERETLEGARAALSDAPCSIARRKRARARRDAAWREGFAEVEDAAGIDRRLLARNPHRRGAPIRRLCNASVCPPPSAEAVRAQYEKARGRGRVEEKIRLGSMLLDAEATVDSSLIRDTDGEIVGRQAGLRGWIAATCPELLKHYATLMGYRRLAAEFRDAHGLSDPCPAAMLLDEASNEEGKLPPSQRAILPAERRRARVRLRSPEAATVKSFVEELRARRGRERRPA